MLPYQTISQKEDGIAIVGLGGAGANILQCFGGSSAENVRLCSMSLDERVGRASGNVEFIQLGAGLNHGLGSGGDPSVGRQAALDSSEALQELLQDKRLLVMVVGLGGGTGSGAAPVLAELARRRDMFLVSVVVMPFAFEGKRRREQAEQALEDISRLSDIVYCFENDYMEELFRNRAGARAVFEEVNRLLAKATASVPMLASSPGMINLGLDELASALENNDSRCLFGSGSGYGPQRAEDAAKDALESPLIRYRGALRFARTVIAHVAGGDSMSLSEVRRAMESIRAALASDEVQIFFGITVKPHLGDEMRVTLIASIDGQEFKEALAEEAPQAAIPPTTLPKDEEDYMEEEVDSFPEEEEEEAPAAPEAKDDELFEAEEDAAEDEGSDAPAEAPAPQEEEEEEELFPGEEEEEEEATPQHSAPVLQAATAPIHQTSFRLDLDSEAKNAPQKEDLPIMKELRDDSANSRAFNPEAVRRRNMTAGDDLDTPPSLRFNDLRDIFPDN